MLSVWRSLAKINPESSKHFHSTFCSERLSTCFSHHELFSSSDEAPERQHNCHTAKRTEIEPDEWHVFEGRRGGRVRALMKVFLLLALWSSPVGSNLLWFRGTSKDGNFHRRLNSEKVISFWERASVGDVTGAAFLSGRCAVRTTFSIKRIF